MTRPIRRCSGGLCWIAIFAGGWLAAAAEPPAKPRCTAASAGRFWPEEANDNRAFAAELTRYGYLEICTAGRWGYRWQSPTVQVNQLAKRGYRKADSADRRRPESPQKTSSAQTP